MNITFSTGKQHGYVHLANNREGQELKDGLVPYISQNASRFVTPDTLRMRWTLVRRALLNHEPTYQRTCGRAFHRHSVRLAGLEPLPRKT